MKFFDWLGHFFKKNEKSGVLNISSAVNIAEQSVSLYAFAVYTAIDIIASLISKCDYRVYDRGRENKAFEWYTWNVRPNKNQTSTEFWHEFISRLLFFGEVLVVRVGTQHIISENTFSKQEFSTDETVFTAVSRNGEAIGTSYRMSEVIYCRYTTFDAKAILASIFSMYEKLITAASDKYIKSGGQKGTLEVPAAAKGDKDFETNYKNLMNNYFKSYFKSENAVLPLWNGLKYTPTSTASTQKNTSEVSDISRLVDDAMARAAQAYKIPVSLVRGDVAGVNENANELLTVCIDPIANLISEELTSKKFNVNDVIGGSRIEADTTTIKHIDLFDIAQNADKLIADGICSVNEVRDKAGLTTVSEPWADEHFITKNYENVKGGESDEKAE